MKTVDDYRNFIDKIENSCENKDLVNEQISLEIVLKKVNKLFEVICNFY